MLDAASIFIAAAAWGWPADNTKETTMAIQRTFSIIKPDATKRNLTGAINAKIEAAGLRIIAQKRIHLTPAQAGVFYAVHKERPFYGELCEFMASEPVVVQVLEGENAIAKYREVMGATDPAEAAEGTIRKDFALSKGENSVHGSDAPFPQCPFRKMLNTRKRAAVEFKIPDSGRRVMVTVDPVLDEDGNLLSAVHTVRDMGERRENTGSDSRPS